MDAVALIVFSVVLGGVTTYFATALLERRQRTSRARAGAQLVHVELLHTYSTLEGAITGQAPFPANNDDRLHTDAWHQHRSDLIGALRQDGFDKLLETYLTIQALNTTASTTSTRRLIRRGSKPIDDTEFLEEAAAEVWAATNVVAELAGYGQVQRPDPPR